MKYALNKKECRRLFSLITTTPQKRKDIFYAFFDNSIYADTEDRRLRSAIHEMQLMGFPIATTTDGYFRISKSNRALFDKAQAQRNARIKAESAIYYANQRAGKEAMGQGRLKGFNEYWKEEK